MKKLLSLFALTLLVFTAAAQNRVVEGTVSDKQGYPVAGATVRLKGTTTGTTTDTDGGFRLAVPEAQESTLIFSFMGMTTREVALGNETRLDVVLEEDAQRMEDIVVIGYGVARKGDLTGSVESIKADKLTMGVATNAAQMLQGRVPGLYINSHNQDPGTTGDIMLRGIGSITAGSQPLVVVDGFPADSPSVLNTINPNEIEQIDVLKDASATAIYGARGANGVIIVTTKTGRQDSPLRVEYNGKLSTETIARRLDVLDSDEYIRFWYDYGNDPLRTVTLPTAHEGNYYPYPLSSIGKTANTDWQKEVTKSGRITQDHTVTATGGGKNIGYRATVGYYDGRGIVTPYNYKRFNAQSKLDYSTTKWGFNMDLSYTKENSNNARNSYLNAVRFAPTVKTHDAAGELSPFPVENVARYLFNPLYNETALDNTSEHNTMRALFSLHYNLLPGLRIEGRAGYQRGFSENYSYEPETAFGKDDGSISYGNNSNLNLDAILTYVNTFGKHGLNAMAATNYQAFRNRGNYMHGYGFPASIIRYYNMGSVADKNNTDISSYWNTRSLQSFLARASYDYDKRYYLTLNFRVDGASQFGDSEKFGYFPSAALAWRIDNEDFFTSNYINNFKLKVGYGLSGNSNVPSNRTQALLTYIPVYLGGEVHNGVDWAKGNGDNSYKPNPNLRWEGAKTLNVGLELGGKHFAIDFNAYRKDSYELIIDRLIPLETGFRYITMNKGSMLNYGIELKIDGFFNWLSGDLSWRPSIWGAWNYNELIDFDGIKNPTFGVWQGTNFYGYAGMQQEGYPIGALWGYDYAGVWNSDEADIAALYGALPGDPKFVDRKTTNADGTVSDGADGKLDDNDKRYMGNTIPTYTLGFSSTLQYKNWSFSFMFDGVFDKKAINYNRMYMIDPRIQSYGNMGREVLDRWTPDRQDTDIPGLARPLPGNLAISNFCIEDASFLRLREVTISYQYTLRPNKYLQSIRVYLTGTNLATFTDYSGVNPDVYQMDVSYNIRPLSRSYLLGVNLLF